MSVRNGNGREWEQLHGNNMVIGISQKLENGSGRELTAWEWEGMAMSKAITAVSRSF